MITLVNNHVLFPNSCDWAQNPDWSRQWANDVGMAVTGAESRNAVRVHPRVSLSFLITPGDVVEQSELDDRIRAALKSGYACAPMHGCGQLLNSNASGSSVEVKSGRTWLVGEYIFFQAADESFEVRQITSAVFAAGVWTLGFTGALTASYSAGNFVWPLIFGKFEFGDMRGVSPKTGPARIRITELVSASSAALGAVVPPGGTGIGAFKIGSTFQVS